MPRPVHSLPVGAAFTSTTSSGLLACSPASSLRQQPGRRGCRHAVRRGVHLHDGASRPLLSDEYVAEAAGVQPGAVFTPMTTSHVVSTSSSMSSRLPASSLATRSSPWWLPASYLPRRACCRGCQQAARRPVHLRDGIVGACGHRSGRISASATVSCRCAARQHGVEVAGSWVAVLSETAPVSSSLSSRLTARRRPGC